MSILMTEATVSMEQFDAENGISAFGKGDGEGMYKSWKPHQTQINGW